MGELGAVERERTLSASVRLAVEHLVAGYGKRRVLHDVSLHVGRGEVVTVLGHNGAGKSTLLKAIFGLIPLEAGAVSLDGSPYTRISTVESVRRGMSYVPAEMPVFRELTIRENLELGAFTISSTAERDERLGRVHDLFPLLRERADDRAETLSGGQQRLLSLGITLMSDAQLMLLDEPSLGIAPSLVAEIFETIGRLCREEGRSIFLIEQNVRAALPLADRVYFMRNGKILLEETAELAREREDWWELF